ncbi:bZIP_ATF6 domain-containing protein ATf6 isoform X1 [Ptiloglossa arizonensis]|uniref:bZIP_ATF6 domain-containing protein ATf6 isoform X1 n=1 Tax=Ptiloglossa arizonensis TaxID=3350558 RepID=UPI003F9F9074
MLINQDPQWSGVVASEIQMFPDLELIDDGDCSPLSDDLFQTLSSELGMPLFLDSEVPSETNNDFNNQITKDVSLGESATSFEDFAINVLQQNSVTDLDATNDVNLEIKLEPSSPYVQLPLSPASSHSESSRSESQVEIDSVAPLCDFKSTLETPPISPPQNVSPPVSPEPILNAAIAKQIRLMPLKSQDEKHTKFILSKGNSAKRVRVQPKDNVQLTTDEQPQNAIFLSAQNFVALTQKVKQNYTSYPFTAHLLPTNGNVKNQTSVQFSPLQIKAEASTVQIPQENCVKLVDNTTPDVCISGREPTVSVADTSLILKNGTTGCTSIVVKNDSSGCRPIVIKTENSNYTPIVIKNETQDIVNFSGRQECEIKALKRQQRMIKNRESACLSRKKKKEYVSSLEKQICELQHENKHLKMENTNLKQKLSALEDTMGTGNKLRGMNLNANKKNVAILLGMIFMVSLNVNSFSGILLQSNRLNMLPADVPVSSQYVRHGRKLLWTPKDQISEEDEENIRKNTSIPQPMCPMHINQSESIRLDYELRRWIGGESDQYNWTTSKKAKSDAKLLGEVLSLPLAMQRKSKDKHKLKINLSRRSKSEIHRKTTDSTISNAVEVFSPTLKEHASLFEALGRRDDTFYVVWFSGEHLLLPASSKNSTGRPRMSLVLPALPMNETFSTPANHITMMQIDCEVTNTQLLHLQQSVIPNHLKSNNRSGSHTRETHGASDVSDAVTANMTKNYKPYFIKESDHKILHERNLKDIYVDKNTGSYNKTTAYILKQKFVSEFDLEEVKTEMLRDLRKTESRTRSVTSQKAQK